jgi:hypothetical protein
VILRELTGHFEQRRSGSIRWGGNGGAAHVRRGGRPAPGLRRLPLHVTDAAAGRVAERRARHV